MALSDAVPEIIAFLIGIALNLPEITDVGTLVVSNIQGMSTNPVVVETCNNIVGLMSVLGLMLILASIISILIKWRE